MGENSKIGWTHHTFNLWIGCEKIAAGCLNCYAAVLASVYGWAEWGKESLGGSRRVASESKWREPLKWDRAAAKAGERRRVFCASLADVWEDWRGPMLHASGVPLWRMHDDNGHAYRWGAGHVLDVPGSGVPLTAADVRRRLFELIDATPNLDWLVLTKRPENVRRLWPLAAPFTASDGSADVIRRRLENLWLGTSISDPDTAENNLRELYGLRTLSPVVFASAEPLVAPIDFAFLRTDPLNSGLALTDGFGFVDGEGPAALDWLIVGGESGPDGKRRDCGVAALVDVARQAVAADVPVYVKQDCARKPEQQGRIPADVWALKQFPTPRSFAA